MLFQSRAPPLAACNDCCLELLRWLVQGKAREERQPTWLTLIAGSDGSSPSPRGAAASTRCARLELAGRSARGAPERLQAGTRAHDRGRERLVWMRTSGDMTGKAWMRNGGGCGVGPASDITSYVRTLGSSITVGTMYILLWNCSLYRCMVVSVRVSYSCSKGYYM